MTDIELLALLLTRTAARPVLVLVLTAMGDKLACMARRDADGTLLIETEVPLHTEDEL